MLWGKKGNTNNPMRIGLMVMPPFGGGSQGFGWEYVSEAFFRFIGDYQPAGSGSNGAVTQCREHCSKSRRQRDLGGFFWSFFKILLLHTEPIGLGWLGVILKKFKIIFFFLNLPFPSGMVRN